MWSPVYSTRNRVSPIQKPEHRQNGYTRSWVTPVGSTSNVHIEVGRNDVLSSPIYGLTKLIRIRKYGEQDSRVEDLLDRRENQKKWTPSLTERLKDKDFEKSESERSGYSGWMYRRKQDMRELGYKLELWRSWFKKIEGHQGTGVLSYFMFLKWILFLNIYIFLLVFCFTFLPAIIMKPQGNYTTAVTSTIVSSTTEDIADDCSDLYNVSFSCSAGNLILDFIQGTGWMEQTALFYGWYEAKELELDNTYYNNNTCYILPLAYFLTALGVLLLSLILMARFTIGSMNEGNYELKQANIDYSNKTFGNWDYGLDDETTAQLKQQSIYNDIVANLDHQRYLLTTAQRTACKTCVVYTKRIIVNCLILAILGGAGYGIYRVTELSTDYTDNESDRGTFLFLLMQYLPSLTITMLNVIVPLLFELLVKLEDYTEDVVVKITLLRTVFLRLASLTVLIVSMYVSITCTVTTNPKCLNPEKTCTDPKCLNLEKTCTEIKCWETYVGQAFYRLMVTDYLAHILVIFCYELPRKLITTKCCSSAICKKIGPAEFIVYISVLDLVYTQALTWTGFLFCPLITGCAVLNFITQFYLKLFSALYTTVPPEKPYKASRSNNFFMIVLLITFFLSSFPVGYSMVRMMPSRGCGPFRIYNDMSIIVNVTIENFPTWLQSTIEIFTSASFIILLLTVLCLAIYYLYARGSAYKERTRITTDQLIMEGKDKQYLLAKIYRQTGDGAKSKGTSKTNQKENDFYSDRDYEQTVAAKTKTFMDNGGPPPAAYNSLDVTWRRKARMDLYARR